MPITAAFVVKHESNAGGGLVVDETGCMVIVDKKPSSQESKYFNPMLFATLCKKPIDAKLDEQLLFSTKKFKNGRWIVQAESASTHIATNPSSTLKRIVSVPKPMKKQVFSEQKTLCQSDLNRNERISANLKRDMRTVHKSTTLSLNTYIDTIHRIQETAIKFLHSRHVMTKLDSQFKGIKPYHIDYLGFDTLKGSVARNLINHN